jgi:hypothetical protein
MSDLSSWKKVMQMESSKGTSMRATTSSKNSLSPWNSKRVRAEREVRVVGGGRRFPGSGLDGKGANSMMRDLRLANAARLVTIVSGEKYPESGIFKRVRLTR